MTAVFSYHQVVKAFVLLTASAAKSDDKEALARDIQEHVKQTTAPYKYPRKVNISWTLETKTVASFNAVCSLQRLIYVCITSFNNYFPDNGTINTSPNAEAEPLKISTLRPSGAYICVRKLRHHPLRKWLIRKCIWHDSPGISCYPFETIYTFLYFAKMKVL